jgi:hypothetical protein
MIPSEFRDYFVNSSKTIQQEIVSSLLSISTSNAELSEDKDQKAVSCPL